MRTITTYSPEETMELASRIAGALRQGDLVALVGEIGAGKTTFVKGLARGLGVKDYVYVNSPSFVVLKEYQGKRKLYHFDIYRLEEEAFRETLDYERYFYDDGITVVEWAEKIREVLPEDYLEVDIEYGDHTRRRLSFRPVGERFKGLVNKM